MTETCAFNTARVIIFSLSGLSMFFFVCLFVCLFCFFLRQMTYDLIYVQNKREPKYERVCCIRVYYIYQEIWCAAVGEVLMCNKEPKNFIDGYAVTVRMME